jgi:hypothetical protein
MKILKTKLIYLLVDQISRFLGKVNNSIIVSKAWGYTPHNISTGAIPYTDRYKKH